jgi:nucleotide-binding universal stress UspA family protein
MKVLVPTDGSEQSMKAVQRALEMAEKQDARVTLMAVSYFTGDFDDMPPNVREKLEAEARENLQKARAIFDQKKVSVKVILESGLVPANNIIRRAEDDKFDRIIMGSTGATGLARALMGSTAAKVVAHAPCEVTVVR